MPRQKLFEEIKLPPLKSLRQDSVATSYQHPPKPVTEKSSLGVSEHLLGDLPGSVVIQLFFINQDSHQLGDGKSRVGVVHLDTDVIGQLGPGQVKLGEAAEHVLQRGADPNWKEHLYQPHVYKIIIEFELTVLLHHSKLLTSVHVVIGIKYPGLSILLVLTC